MREMSTVTLGRLRLVALPVLLISLVVGLTGCGPTMRDLPLPGTGVSGDTMQITASFKDALNLAQGAPVKVNGVDSGKVKEVTVDDYVATVEMTVRKDAKIRSGATARLRYTTPLGELFVDITNPDAGKAMADGAKMSLEQTATAPTVENALASASLLINGGGLGQLQTVTRELNTVLVGNEKDIKAMLRNALTFLSQANAASGSIDRVLNSLNRVSSTLSKREKVINRVIRDIRPAVQVLTRATPKFTKLLRVVKDFSQTANATVRATKQQLLTLLGEVEPVLAELASNRPRFNTMLRKIVAAGKTAEDAIPGDYLTLDVSLTISTDLGSLLSDLPAFLLDALNLGSILGAGGLLQPSTAAKPGGNPAGLGTLVENVTKGAN